MLSICFWGKAGVALYRLFGYDTDSGQTIVSIISYSRFVSDTLMAPAWHAVRTWYAKSIIYWIVTSLWRKNSTFFSYSEAISINLIHLIQCILYSIHTLCMNCIWTKINENAYAFIVIVKINISDWFQTFRTLPKKFFFRLKKLKFDVIMMMMIRFV